MQTFYNKNKLLSIFFILLISYLFGIRILLIFSYSTDLDGSEYIFVYFTQSLLSGKPIYNNPTEFPYLACIFAPVYIYGLKHFVSLFNINLQQNIHFIYIAGRCISLFFFLIHLFFFTAYIRIRFKIPYRHVLFFIVVYLLLISGHMYVLRPDSLKFLFFTIAFLFLTEYEYFNQKTVYLIVFLVLSVINVFIKQDTLIYVCLLLFVWYFTTYKKQYLILTVVYIVLVCFAFYILSLIFGPYFFTNIVLFNFQKTEHFLTPFNVLIVIFSISRILPLIIVLYFLRENKIENNNEKNIIQKLIILIISFMIVSHLFMLRAGSFINYAYETIFLIIFSLMILSGNIKTDFILKKPQKFMIMIYVLFLFSTNIILHSYTYSFNVEKRKKREYFENINTAEIIKSKIRNEVVFLPNIRNTIYFTDCNLILGYDYNVGKFFNLYIPLEKQKYFKVKMQSHLYFFDAENYEKNFKNGTVKYIINDANREYFIKENFPLYKMQENTGNLSIYSFTE